MSCKAMILLSRRSDMTAAEFRSWWLQDHAPLARQLPRRRIGRASRARRRTVDDAGLAWRAAAVCSRAGLDAAYATELGQRVAADSMAHVRGRVRMFVDEHPVAGT